MKNGQIILRYAELALKRDRQLKLEQNISPQEEEEMKNILSELGLSHVEVLDCAIRNLMDESE